MSNTLAVSALVAKESLAILKNNLAFSKFVNRKWQDNFTTSGSSGKNRPSGNTINIPKPPRYSYRAGRQAVPQSTVESTVPLTLSQGGADLLFTSNERTNGIDEMSKKIQAAMASVVTEIDRQGCDLMRTAAFNTLGTIGTAPATQAAAVAAMTSMKQRLTEMGAPVNDKRLALAMSPALNGALIQGYAGLFNNTSRVSKMQDSGLFLDGYGAYAEVDQCIAQHTNGTCAAGTAVTVGSSGASIAVAAITGTLTKGTKITLPGVYAVNPQTRISTGVLAQFTLTADVSNGATSLPVSPSLVATGAFQNASNVTTAGSFVIFGGASATYSCSGMFHEDAFTLAMVDLEPLPGVESYTESSDGFSVRVSSGTDIANDTVLTRIDVLFGWAATYPELACLYVI